MKKTIGLILAFSLVASVAFILLVGCPKPDEIPMSIYRGTVYGATPYFNNAELSLSESYYFNSNDVIVVRYKLTADEGNEYAEHQLPVGRLANVGGLFRIVDYIRDPQSIVGYEVLSRGDRFAIIKVNN